LRFLPSASTPLPVSQTSRKAGNTVFPLDLH
jgi:hypothetical protein